jgi:hypothetical protein
MVYLAVYNYSICLITGCFGPINILEKRRFLQGIRSLALPKKVIYHYTCEKYHYVTYTSSFMNTQYALFQAVAAVRDLRPSEMLRSVY